MIKQSRLHHLSYGPLPSLPSPRLKGCLTMKPLPMDWPVGVEMGAMSIGNNINKSQKTTCSISTSTIVIQ
jgi:hypothetical protein